MDNVYNTNKHLMYQFPNQQHYPHNLYPQCHNYLEHTKHNVNPTVSEGNFPVFSQQSAIPDIPLHTNESLKIPESQSFESKAEKKRKNVTKKIKASATNSEDSKKKLTKIVDTSIFSIEERLVAAVWIHERHHTHDTITEIKHKFLRRFGRDPPSKTTLFAWERKLFATGNVCDAPRTGRPVNRKAHIPSVAASLAAAPALSLRARAAALRLSRTMLHNILHKDLPPHQRRPPPPPPPPPGDPAADKQGAKRRVNRPLRRTSVPAGLPPPPAGPPLPPACDVHYVPLPSAPTYT